MPLTDRSQAKESGFAQVRAALQKFKGDVTSAEFGQWGGELVDEKGRVKPPREFLEIETTNVEVLEVTEELSMEIEEWNFRENCSEYKGSFWFEKFIDSMDKFKIPVPDGLVGKRITWEKVTLEAVKGDGTRQPQYDSTNFIVVGVEEITAAPKAIPAVVAKPVATAPVEVSAEAAEATPDTVDGMAVALDLAVGKTEAQFRTAISLKPELAGNPILPLAKAGIVTQALVNDGKLVLVDGKYQLPG